MDNNKKTKAVERRMSQNGQRFQFFFVLIVNSIEFRVIMRPKLTDINIKMCMVRTGIRQLYTLILKITSLVPLKYLIRALVEPVSFDDTINK